MKCFSRLLFACLLLSATIAAAAPQCNDNYASARMPGPHPHMKIALTFDDGPNPETTPQILAILRKYQISATFFLIGGNIPGHEAIVRQELAEGHNIGNHTYTHPQMTTLTPAAARLEFAKTDVLLAQFPKTRPRVARLPFGDVNCDVKALADSMHYNLIGWDADSCDYNFDDALKPGVCVPTKFIEQYRNDYLGWVDHQLSVTHGGVILMHDSTVWERDHLEQTILHLKAQGYEFVTLDSSFPWLLKDQTQLPGAIDPSLFNEANHPPDDE